ncbi:arabinosyltransferase domain-containing protein [Nocardia camponoti]|uniref:arabinosyltransferase domain-containing protein n=1 Tax=Nocardia camponoti TaxID=1616106 RepID=UPI00227D62E8|nr:arabinosyltransferase domain-containing protein [Nocardia camponoti]
MQPDSPGLSRISLIGIAAGVLGGLLAVAVPLLPVEMSRPSLNWPQPQSLQVSAPLVDYVPLTLSARVPCSAITPEVGTVLATVPPAAPRAGSTGLIARVDERGALSVVLRDKMLLSVPVSELGACEALTVSSSAEATTVSLLGTAHTTTLSGDVRPQVVGVFTDLDRTRLGDAFLHANIDARFSSTPSVVKRLATWAAVVCAMVALWALARGEGGRRRLGGWRRGARRRGGGTGEARARLSRLSAVDAVVLAVLGIWHVIGANSSDDGYILTMARASQASGYIANYYRWYGVAEAPFGWPYEVLAYLARVSEAGVWMRLPALVAGVVCWWLLSRKVLPRLGTRGSAASWTAALVFLALWLPYNNGLRPEPIIAVGVLVCWYAMERAIATRRLLPVAVAVGVAAFCLAAGPTGLVCVGALIAGSRPVLGTVIARARALSGPAVLRYAAVLAPIAAVGTLVLVVVFADQTVATVLEATRVRQAVGPDMSWFEERTRWDSLLSVNPDGSLARRFGVLTMLLSLVVCTVTALWWRGRIPLTARGPVLRLLAVVALALGLMMFTPTKWTHHFGVYAGLAAALAAVVTVAVSRVVLRPNYFRTLYAAAVLFVLAVCFTGSNGWWYVSGYGVLFPDRAPVVGGISVSTVLLCATGVALAFALVQFFHGGAQRDSGVFGVGAESKSVDLADTTGAVRRAQWTFRRGAVSGPRAATPLTIAAAAMVAFEVGSLGIAAASQFPSYSVGLANLRALAGSPCALGDKVLVETNTADSLLLPYTGTAADGLAAENTGFTPNGVGSLTPDPGPGENTAPPSGSGPPGGSGGPGGSPSGGAPSGGGPVGSGPTGASPGGSNTPNSGGPAGPSASPAGGAPSSGGPGPAGGPANGANPGPNAPTNSPGVGAPSGPTAPGPQQPGPSAAPTGPGSGPVPGDASRGGSAPVSGAPSAPGTGSPAPGGPPLNGTITPGGAPSNGTTTPGGPPPNGTPAPGGPPANGTVAPGGPSPTPGAPSAPESPSTPVKPADQASTAKPDTRPAGPPDEQGKPGINGSTVALPFGLAPERTPVLGSYSTGEPKRNKLTTQWYRLDAPAHEDYRVLILTVAGRIESVGPDGKTQPGQRLRVEFAHHNDDGTTTPTGDLTPPSVGGAPGWRNLPIALDRIPANTNAIRLVAEGEADPMQWLALTPPRVPKLSSLDTVVGQTTPVIADWHVGLAFPCQRPFNHRDGVAELPIWRIQPDKLNAQVSETWQGASGGGPLGWSTMLMRSRAVPAYLADDWTRDWGELQRLTRIITAPPAEITPRTETTWGLETDTPIRLN